MESYTQRGAANPCADDPPPYRPQHEQPPAMEDDVVPAVSRVIVVLDQLGPKPARVTCKSCHYEVITTIKPKPSTRTHIIAGILFLSFLWPCVCIPYCIDSCMNIDHYCPKCQSYIGSHFN